MKCAVMHGKVDCLPSEKTARVMMVPSWLPPDLTATKVRLDMLHLGGSSPSFSGPCCLFMLSCLIINLQSETKRALKKHGSDGGNTEHDKGACPRPSGSYALFRFILCGPERIQGSFYGWSWSGLETMTIRKPIFPCDLRGSSRVSKSGTRTKGQYASK
jgi:hypothetical protein